MKTIAQPALTYVYRETLSERVGRETLIVTGSPRGGTSAVAYALRRLGYFLGDRLGGKNHEDLDLLNAFDSSSRRKRRAAFGAVACVRNAQHERWGFKLPKAALHLDDVAAGARNPVAIIIYRNPLAVGRSIVGRGPNFPQGDDGLLKAVSVASERMLAASRHVLALKLPAILVDFDIFRTDAGSHLEELRQSLQLSADTGLVTEIAAEIAAPGYKKISKK